jgi:hypothetical protein
MKLRKKLWWLWLCLWLIACNDQTLDIPLPTATTAFNRGAATRLSGSPLPVGTANSRPPNTGVALEVGLNLYLYPSNDKVVAQSLAWMADLKVSWVRLPLYWNEIEPVKGQHAWENTDKAVTTLRQAGINILFNVVHCPSWAAITPDRPGLPRNMADFADLMKAAATRYKGQIAAYEIWNEPNLEREAGKPIKAGAYVELLKAGYQALKSVDRAIIVVTAGLTPTGVNNPQSAVDDLTYLKEFYAYNQGEAKKYYDVLGLHPGSSQNPPDTLWRDRPGPGPGWRDHPSFYFRRIEQLRQVMVENGERQKPTWLTEFGWASTPHPAPGFGFAALVSEDQQAQYISQAMLKSWLEYNWVQKMFVFQLNMALPEFTPDPADERIAWGLIRRDGTPRPAYFAVQNFIKDHS